MKAAIYIEVKGRTNGRLNGKIYPWAGYIYANEEVNPKDYTFEREGKDQYDKPIKIYRGKETIGYEYPGGVTTTDLVVLF